MRIRNSVLGIAAVVALLACGGAFESAPDTESDGGRDGGPIDSSASDATSVDVANDQGVPDTSKMDTGTADARPGDTGSMEDTGAADAPPADTGTADTGPKDTGAADACSKTCADTMCPVGEHCCPSIQVDGCASCIAGTGDICPG